MVRVEDAEKRAHQRDDGGLGLARSWLKWISGCSEKTWAKTTGEWRSVAWDLLGGRAHSGNGDGGGVSLWLLVLGSNGEERGRGWSRLRLRGREEAVARVLASVG